MKPFSQSSIKDNAAKIEVGSIWHSESKTTETALSGSRHTFETPLDVP
jgi:hypothetical protein